MFFFKYSPHFKPRDTGAVWDRELDNEKEGFIGMMTELEMCDTLGILIEPGRNRVKVTRELRQNIGLISQAFSEMTTQKELYGTVNQDIWLEFVPWHSLN